MSSSKVCLIILIKIPFYTIRKTSGNMVSLPMRSASPYQCPFFFFGNIIYEATNQIFPILGNIYFEATRSPTRR